MADLHVALDVAAAMVNVAIEVVSRAVTPTPTPAAAAPGDSPTSGPDDPTAATTRARGHSRIESSGGADRRVPRFAHATGRSRTPSGVVPTETAAALPQAPVLAPSVLQQAPPPPQQPPQQPQPPQAQPKQPQPKQSAQPPQSTLLPLSPSLPQPRQPQQALQPPPLSEMPRQESSHSARPAPISLVSLVDSHSDAGGSPASAATPRSPNTTPVTTTTTTTATTATLPVTTPAAGVSSHAQRGSHFATAAPAALSHSSSAGLAGDAPTGARRGRSPRADPAAPAKTALLRAMFPSLAVDTIRACLRKAVNLQHAVSLCHAVLHPSLRRTADAVLVAATGAVGAAVTAATAPAGSAGGNAGNTTTGNTSHAGNTNNEGQRPSAINVHEEMFRELIASAQEAAELVVDGPEVWDVPNQDEFYGSVAIVASDTAAWDEAFLSCPGQATAVAARGASRNAAGDADRTLRSSALVVDCLPRWHPAPQQQQQQQQTAPPASAGPAGARRDTAVGSSTAVAAAAAAAAQSQKQGTQATPAVAAAAATTTTAASGASRPASDQRSAPPARTPQSTRRHRTSIFTPLAGNSFGNHDSSAPPPVPICEVPPGIDWHEGREDAGIESSDDEAASVASDEDPTAAFANVFRGPNMSCSLAAELHRERDTSMASVNQKMAGLIPFLREIITGTVLVPELNGQSVKLPFLGMVPFSTKECKITSADIPDNGADINVSCDRCVRAHLRQVSFTLEPLHFSYTLGDETHHGVLHSVVKRCHLRLNFDVVFLAYGNRHYIEFFVARMRLKKFSLKARMKYAPVVNSILAIARNHIKNVAEVHLTKALVGRHSIPARF